MQVEATLSAVYSGLADLDQKVIDDLKRQYISVLPDLETELSRTTVANEIGELKARLRLKRAAQIDREAKAMEDHEVKFSVQFCMMRTRRKREAIEGKP